MARKIFNQSTFNIALRFPFAGVDGLGGGGCGGAKGGSGIVIIRYKLPTKGTVISFR